MACEILERISGLEPSSEATAPRCLKLVAVPSFFALLTFSSSGCHWRCLSSVFFLLSTDFSLIHYEGFVETFN